MMRRSLRLLQRAALGDPAALAAEAHRDGFVLIPGLYEQSLVKELGAAFAPLLRRRMQHPPDRGPGRYYVTPPFTGPWSDPALIMNSLVLDLVERLVGPEPVLCQVGVDCPLGDGKSDFQEVHRDCAPLFPTTSDSETPPFQLAVNIPLCDVPEAERGTPTDRGPVEIHRGSHLWTPQQGEQALQEGKVPLEPVWMRAGDALVRDVRGLHRGTPNYGPDPRPVVVLGYSARWLRRPEVGIRVPRDYLARAHPTVQQLLRYETVVDSVEEYTGVERYDTEVLTTASGGSYVER